MGHVDQSPKATENTSDHDSATSDHSSSTYDDLKLENDDLRQQIDLLKICLAQKDALVKSLDSKTSELQAQVRDSNAAMQEWAKQLNSKIVQLQVSYCFVIHNLFTLDYGFRTKSRKRTSPSPLTNSKIVC